MLCSEIGRIDAFCVVLTMCSSPRTTETRTSPMKCKFLKMLFSAPETPWFARYRQKEVQLQFMIFRVRLYWDFLHTHLKSRGPNENTQHGARTSSVHTCMYIQKDTFYVYILLFNSPLIEELFNSNTLITLIKPTLL